MHETVPSDLRRFLCRCVDVGGRFVNPKSPPMTLYPTTVLDNGLMWSPKLTFAHRRPPPIVPAPAGFHYSRVT